MKTIACIYCEGNDTKLAVVSQDKNGNRLKIISTASVDVVSNKSNLQPTAGFNLEGDGLQLEGVDSVSYTHLRAHETVLDLVCRLLLEKKNTTPEPT